MSPPDTDALTDLPPSAKLVHKLLEYHGSQTQQELVEESMLSARAVRSAINDLRDVGAITESIYPPDARQSLYRLSDEESADDPLLTDGEPGTDSELPCEAAASDETCSGD